MTLLRRHIYHLTGVISLLVLFSISLYVRKDDLKTDLGRHHEWITAHALITMEIWEKNGGPSAFGFNPIYTYPDAFVFPRRALGGVTDENGWNYYVSYPPFAFIFGYYATQLLGGPDVDSIRTLSVVIHFLCGLFLYLIFAEILARSQTYRFNFAGVLAAGIYYLSTGTLWAHSMLYFVDMPEQLWILMLLWMIVKAFGETRRPWLFISALAILCFVASYTEWLGLFFAFFSGLLFLFFWFRKRKRIFLQSFLAIGISSTFALGLTLIQYSSIAGWDGLYKSSVEKYEERGGFVTDNPHFIHHSGNPETFAMIRSVFDRQYQMAEHFFAVTTVLFIILLMVPATRRRLKDSKILMILLATPICAIGLHYLLFINFNALHDFSAIKFGLMLALCIGAMSHLILTSLNGLKLKLTLGIGLVVLFVFTSRESVRRFHEKYSLAQLDEEWLRSFKKIGALQEPDKAIFVDKFFVPEATWYCKRDYFPAYDSATVSELMLGWHIPKAQYFVHEGSRLNYMVALENRDKKIHTIKMTDF